MTTISYMKKREKIHESDPIMTPEISISKREKEVLLWVEQGKSSSEISLILGITPRTVNAYVYTIMEKLGAVNRPQMVSHAFRKGLLP